VQVYQVGPVSLLVKRWDVFLCLLLQGIFLFWPGIDFVVAGWLYRPQEGFFLSENPLVLFSYQLFADLHLWVMPLLCFLLLWALFCRLATRHYFYLLLVLILAPGFLVNSVLKMESGRARPSQISEFGGNRSFTGAFVKSDQCEKNCSFVSGHAAMGFFPLALAWVFEKRRWLLPGILLGGLVGLGRMMQGAHYLSDVIFAFWVVYFIALALGSLLLGDGVRKTVGRQ
jgi:lipid A 4'-phosphatase